MNDLSDAALAKVKAKMDVNFTAAQLKPGDPGFVYDKQNEFKPTETCEWDDSIIEWFFLLYSTNLKYRVIFFYFSEILMFSYKTQNYYFYHFRMKVLLVPLLISLCDAKKDKFFYCQTCSALIQESFYKVSQVGKFQNFDFFHQNWF